MIQKISVLKAPNHGIPYIEYTQYTRFFSEMNPQVPQRRHESNTFTATEQYGDKMLIEIKNETRIFSFAAVGGKAEKNGPLGYAFDYTDESERFSQKTWESAEGSMQKIALSMALGKRNMTEKDIGVLLAGDLMNQCTASCYGLLSFDIPFVGLFGACSTAAEGLALSAIICDQSGSVCAAVTSSHFCSAERQFRFPLEYGGQRTPTSQRTATASGAFITGRTNEGVRIKSVMFGRSVDSKIKDINNMGAAMAPAAADTMLRFFSESGMKPGDFDLIATGDLGAEGYSITKLIMEQNGYDMGEVYDDCGLRLYDRKRQDMHSGASGCGCSASVACTSILPDMLSGKLGRVLFIGTGALMSPTSLQQGEPIASVAHLVYLEG